MAIDVSLSNPALLEAALSHVVLTGLSHGAPHSTSSISCEIDLVHAIEDTVVKSHLFSRRKGTINY